MTRILNTKLVIPDITQTIHREKLHPLQTEAVDRKLTVVVAGAGYGKTTLIAQTINDFSLDAVWYKLDTSDRDFTTFISYLATGIRHIYPEFGTETQQVIEALDPLDPERMGALISFINEINQLITGDFYLVLDDYHLIHESNEIKETIEYFLEYFPDRIHLILISRSDPALALSRLRSHNKVLDIKAGDLKFNFSETRILYEKQLHLALSHQNLKILCEKVEGWVSGLILFYNSIRGKTPQKIDKNISNLVSTDRMISDYLEENIFAQLPDETKDFLIKTAILPRLNVGLCNQFLCIDNSKDILNDLVNRHLFTYAYNEEKEWFGYHQLFQDFLSEKLASQFDARTISELHLNAAVLMEKRNEFEEAITHYIKAKVFDRACRLLKHIANDFFEKGRVQWMESTLSKIPQEYVNTDPQFQLIQAFFCEAHTDFARALAGYQKAYPNLVDEQLEKYANQCLLAIGRTYRHLGQLKAAEETLISLLEKGNLDLSIHIQALVQLTGALSWQGKIDLADQYIDKAILLLRDSDGQHLGMLGLLYLTRSQRHFDAGNFNKSIHYAEKAKTIFQHTHYFRSLHLLRSHYQISGSYFNLGAFSKGLQSAEEGLRYAEEYDFVGKGSYPYLLLNAAHNLIGLDRTAEAIDMANRGLRLSEEREDILGQALAYTELHLARFCEGEWEAAEAYARSGLELMQHIDMPRIECILNLNLSQALLAKNQLGSSLERMQDAQRLLTDSKSIDCIIALLTALYHWKKDEKSDALNYLTESLTIAQSIGYEFRLVFYTRLIIPMLIALYEQDVMKEYIEKIILTMGSYARDFIKTFIEANPKNYRNSAENLYLKFYAAPSPGLKVQFFGPFTIRISRREITSKDWKSKKAEMLLKYLLYHRSRGFISKEECMELLWPEEDPRKTVKRFHVALAAIRKVLEPHLMPGMPSSYIQRKDDAYCVDIGKTGFVDIEAFSTELTNAQYKKSQEKAFHHFLKAESIMKGDFLGEDQYTDWCAKEREILNEKWLFALKNIIDICENKKDYSVCIRYASNYLYHEPIAEDIYRRLMKFYAHENNLPMVKKTFDKCKKNLATHLDCPVSDETEQLFQQLLSLQ